MEAEIRTIKTGVDKLVELIRERKRVSVDEAAKLLSMPKELVEELADFLEEREVIGIEYKFAVPYLVFKEMTRGELQERAKQFAGRKVGFVRKIESAIQNIDHHSESMARLKEEFAILNKELDTKVINAKGELDMLSRYEQMKRDIDNQIMGQQKAFMSSKQAIDTQISVKRKAIANLIKQITDEEVKLTKEENMTQLLRADQDSLLKTLKEAARKTELIEEKLSNGKSVVEESISRISKYKELAASAKQDMQKQEETLAPLLEESKGHERRINELRKNFLSKVAEQSRESSKSSQKDVAKLRTKFKALFNKKSNAEKIVNRLNSDLDDIKKELRALAKEATVVQLTTKSKNVTEVVGEFENKFSKLNQKKEKFEKEVYKLTAQLQKF